ncbi:meiotic expression up-regulated protein [Lichtheimia corymbifera JMRC:FSU:9682]|uniref:Meiotic expression up-regulated protein n=1 Tax=Lichtheimia corymbifera JMRC:FSU:9682 TaxID=1263082 RepID=A0A068RTI3_9FUNG|nr:meiotic expression up-regulated protein [Lichtheimia corymbifera JMRC:FSU:9682]
MKLLSIATGAGLLALASQTAYAASCSGDIKVTSQGDLESLSTCKKYQGTITIDRTAINKISFSGVEALSGDLIVKDNDALSTLDLGSIKIVDGQVKLENNKVMNKFIAKSLTGVRSFEIAVHPALANLAFAAGLEQADRFIVSDTTTTRIDGLKLSKVSELVIDNNIYLKSVDFGNMTEVSSSLKVSANSPSLNLDLKNVKKLKDAAFRNLAGVALDNLKQVSGDISFISNTFGELSLPEISDVAGTLTITSNSQLSKLGLPKLQRLGGALSVGNNNNLGTIDSFPKLEEVDGTLDITGNFDEVQLPKLADVRGGLNVQTSSSKFSCNDMSKLKNGVIKGNSFMCKAAVAKPKSGMTGKGGVGGSGFDDSSASSISMQLGTIIFGAMSVAGTYLLL